VLSDIVIGTVFVIHDTKLRCDRSVLCFIVNSKGRHKTYYYLLENKNLS